MAVGGRMLGSAASRRLRAAVTGLVLAIVALTVLVEVGALTRVDQFALDHLMPWLRPGAPAGSSSRGLFLPFSLNTNWWSRILDLWTYPCSVLVSAIVLGAVSAVEWRHGRITAVLVLAAAWVIGNGIEVIGKDTITRPALYGTAGGARLHVASFDDSFPSGHMIRGTNVAAAIVLVWRRRARWVALWVLLVGPALVLQSAHTPTDVLGGALVGVLLALLGGALVASPWARRLDRPEPGT